MGENGCCINIYASSRAIICEKNEIRFWLYICPNRIGCGSLKRRIGCITKAKMKGDLLFVIRV